MRGWYPKIEDVEAMYPFAKEVVVCEQKAGVALLQRRLKIGSTFARTLLNLLEQRGVIGPSNAQNRTNPTHHLET